MAVELGDVQRHISDVLYRYLESQKSLSDDDEKSFLNMMMWRLGFLSTQSLSLRELAQNMDRSHEWVRGALIEVESSLPGYMMKQTDSLDHIKRIVDEVSGLCPTSLSHVNLRLSMLCSSQDYRFDLSVLINICNHFGVTHQFDVVHGCVIIKGTPQEGFVNSLIKQVNMAVSRYGACYIPDLVDCLSNKIGFDVYDIEEVVKGLSIGLSTPLYLLDSDHVTCIDAHSPLILIAKKLQAIFHQVPLPLLIEAWGNLQKKQEKHSRLSEAGILLAIGLDRSFDVSINQVKPQILYIGDPLNIDVMLKQYEKAAYTILMSKGIATRKEIMDHAIAMGLSETSMASMLPMIPFITQLEVGQRYCLVGNGGRYYGQWFPCQATRNPFQAYKITRCGEVVLKVKAFSQIENGQVQMVTPGDVLSKLRSMPSEFKNSKGQKITLSETKNYSYIKGLRKLVRLIDRPASLVLHPNGWFELVVDG